MNCRRFAVAWTAFAALALASTPARAGSKIKVVVLEIEGPGVSGVPIERLVNQIVERKHDRVSAKDFAAARKRLAARRGLRAEIAVARAIGADAIVKGKISNRYGRHTLILQVRATGTGKILDTLYAPMRERRVDEREVREGLLEALAWVEPLDPEVIAAANAPVAAKRAKPEKKKVAEAKKAKPEKKKVAAAKKAKPEKQAARTAEEEEADILLAVIEEDSRVASPAPVSPEPVPRAEPANQVRVALSDDSAEKPIEGRAHVGLALVGRELRFASQQGLPAELQPRYYDGTPVGSAYVSGDLFPFMRQGKHLARLGFTVVAEKALRLRSRAVVDGQSEEFGTIQSRYGAGVRYRVPIGQTTLQLAAGYDRLRHKVKTSSKSLSLPDVEYSYVDVGAGLRVPVLERLAVDADGRYLHVLDAGDIADPAAYGGGTVRGVDLEAAVVYSASDSIEIRAGIHYLRMAFAFDGSGAMTDVDADPDMDVGGAADTWLGGFITGGVTF